MPTLAEIMARTAAKAKPAPIRITPESERASLAAQIKTVLDATAPKSTPPAPEVRELGAMTTGEQIPMDHPAPQATEEAKQWFAASHLFATDLCIIIEPAPSTYAWLAVQAHLLSPPILLYRLPLGNRPTEGEPF